MKAMDDVAAPSSELEIRSALDRVIASENLRASPQLASFLRFVVEATLAGQADRIKGYSIAVGALGRNDNFDPQSNPIVRVEAGRLRRALERYYAGPGQQDQVVIGLRRGSYIPTFGRRRMVHRLHAFIADGRRLIPRVVRRRLQFVVAVAAIAASVSVSLNLAVVWTHGKDAAVTCPQVAIGDLTAIRASNSPGAVSLEK